MTNTPVRHSLSWENREKVDECLDAIHKNKNQIIQGKMQDFLREKRDGALEELNELIEDLEESREHIRGTDLAEIKQQQEDVDEVVENICERVVDAWKELIEEQKKEFNELRDTIREEAKEARDIIKSGIDKTPPIEKPKKGLLLYISRKLWGGGYEDRPKRYIGYYSC